MRVQHLNKGKFAGSAGIISDKLGTVTRIVVEAVSIFDGDVDCLYQPEIVEVIWDDGEKYQLPSHLLVEVKS